jgi:hypothetical protein
MGSRRRVLFGLIAVLTGATLLSLAASSVWATSAGESVVGQGKLPGAPELIIEQSGGNDVAFIQDGQSPPAYGGGSNNTVNGCLGADGGIADLGSGTYSYQTKKHQYGFTFADGASVSQFSLVLLDWGDFLPYGVPPGGVHKVLLTAYAGDDVVAITEVSFTSTDSAVNGRMTAEYGSLETAGDACDATEGQPGRLPLTVSGTGITRVTLAFNDLASTDPHVAVTGINYELEGCTDTASLVALIKSFGLPKGIGNSLLVKVDGKEKPFLNEVNAQRRKLAEEQLQQLTACADNVFTR